MKYDSGSSRIALWFRRTGASKVHSRQAETPLLGYWRWLVDLRSLGSDGGHPVDSRGKPPAGTYDLLFYCDDTKGTVANLKPRGVSFKKEIGDHGYGFVTYFTMPRGIEVQLYELKYGSKENSSRIRQKEEGEHLQRELRTEIETTVQVTFGPGTAAQAVARFLAWPS